MMNLDELALMHLLLLSNALLAGAAALAILRCQRLLRRQAGDGAPSAHASAAMEPSDGPTQVVAERLLALQKIAGELAQKERALKRRRVPESQYVNAVRLVRSGAGADDLTRTCGLNKGAAQLLVRLHAKTQAPATAQ